MRFQNFEMASGKKFLSPVIYPLDYSLKKTWFIKYQTTDWVKGGLTFKKYTGQLNLLPTIEQRLELAKKYMAMMKRGETLPSYQGARYFREDVQPKYDTDIVACCNRFLRLFKVEVMSKEKRSATYKQYKSKLDLFINWLEANDMHRRAIGGLSEVEAQDFLLYLKETKKLSNITHNGYRSVLASVWRLYKSQLDGYNPWLSTKVRKRNGKPHESWPLHLQELVIREMPVADPQLWIFLQCVYYCAIRPHSELRLMQVKHIDWDNGMITVPDYLAKNHKERKINIYYELLNQMVKHGIQDSNPDYYIFSYTGYPSDTPASKNYFMRRWDYFRKSYDIPSSYKIYGTKHTAGKKLTLQTNPYITKEHFGLADMKTAEHYIGGIDKNELKFLQKEYPAFGK